MQRRRFICGAITAVAVAAVTPVWAHSKIDKTTPADGAAVGSVPKNVDFDFSKKIRLTKVVMTHMDHPSVNLDLSGAKSFSNTFSVPVIGMGAGPYKIEWRGLGEDGHAMKGAFVFTVE